MDNSIKGRNSREVKMQLKRADVQKNILIKSIYKEYESYFNIVRKSILSSSEKGILGLYSELSVRDSDESLNTRELINFLNQNICILIKSNLPLLTIEQLRLIDIRDPFKQLINKKSLKELVKLKKNKVVNFDYENEINIKESFEFSSNNNSNSYEHYELHNEDDSSSVNLDENSYLNSTSKENSIKNIKYEKNIVDSILEIIEETKPNKSIHHENLNDHVNDIFLSRDNLMFFETIDKAFSHFLLNLSYKINSELFKINLINKTVTEDTFKCLSNNNNNTIKHPHPFIIKYDLNQNKLPELSNKYSDIYLFNISNVELEFYNLDLSISRNKINYLKNRFKLLNKKHLYWKNKELI